MYSSILSLPTVRWVGPLYLIVKSKPFRSSECDYSKRGFSEFYKVIGSQYWRGGGPSSYSTNVLRRKSEQKQGGPHEKTQNQWTWQPLKAKKRKAVIAQTLIFWTWSLRNCEDKYFSCLSHRLSAICDDSPSKLINHLCLIWQLSFKPDICSIY